jgi:hypothetical protein
MFAEKFCCAMDAALSECMNQQALVVFFQPKNAKKKRKIQFRAI